MTKPRNSMAVTPERIEVFLQAYIESFGNFSHACRVASPHSGDTVNPPCRSTFLHLKESDPSFKAALADADMQIKDQVLSEIKRRALEGLKEPIFQKGCRAVDFDGSPASVTRYDNKLLLSLARRLDPAWVEKNVHEYQGQIEHKLVTSADLLRLSPTELETVERALEILGHQEKAKQLEHKPAVTIDAEFEEVKAPVGVSEEETDAIMLYEKEVANAKS